jgi:leukotriene-A4 hydrolase
MERVLQEFLHSPAHRAFSYLIGNEALKDALKGYRDRPKYQRLVIDFEKGEDPDDAYSSVPYEKGANFLLHIGISFFVSTFSPSLITHQKGHWVAWTYSCHTSRTMSQPLAERVSGLMTGRHIFMVTSRANPIRSRHWTALIGMYVFRNNRDALDSFSTNALHHQAWLFGEGLQLPVTLEFDTTLATQAYALAERWDEARGADPSELDFKQDDLAGFDGNQIGQ